MKNMTIDTAIPANIIKIQTLADNGDIKENKSTAFSGALTYNTLIPENKVINQLINFKKDLRASLYEGQFHALDKYTTSIEIKLSQ